MERRRDPRARVILRVDYDSGRALLADYSTDLSTGGLFVRTDLALEVGQPLRLTLSLPGLLEPTVVNGTVRWCKALREGSSHGDDRGVGVAFDSGQEAQLAPILQLVARMQRAMARPPKVARTLDVLLVEDNPFVQDLFRHALRRLHGRSGAEGLRVHSAFTGHEPLRIIPNIDPDLAIIDHFLPGITGAQLVRQLRAQSRFVSLPILVVSTGGRDARSEALASGATVYLDKPVLLTQLVSTIGTILMEPIE